MSNPLVPVPWFTRSALLSRSRQIMTTLTRHGLGWLVNRIGTEILPRPGFGIPDRHTSRAQALQLRLALVELGATFIKLGQALSARSDLLPPEYIEELSKLQDSVPPLPFDHVQPAVETELGAPISELFSRFETEPIASASIGQVYSAALKNGQGVVVKVIRPGVAEQINNDLEILRDMTAWASNHLSIGKRYDLPALVEEFAFTLQNELDYYQEGNNADSFRRNFYDDPRIYIPRVYWDLTTQKVITIEQVGGLKISDLEGLDQASINRHTVAENLMHFAMRQVFEFGFYHADPHPGNFFVQPDGSLAVLDFGMVGHLNNRLMKSLLGMALAIERQDADMLVDELLASGFSSQGIKRKNLSRELERLLSRFSKSEIKELSAARFTSEMMGIALRYGLQLPGELVAMARAISISEGTGTRLNPDFQLAQFAVPYIHQFWMDQRSPRTLMPKIGQAAMDSLEMSLDLPRQISRLISQVERGQFEMNINLDRLKDFSSQMQQMTNRLALAVLLAAIIVALGLVMVVYHPTEWQTLGNWIFGFAFISSLGFGAWLLISIFRSGKN